MLREIMWVRVPPSAPKVDLFELFKKIKLNKKEFEVIKRLLFQLPRNKSNSFLFNIYRIKSQNYANNNKI